MDPFKCAEEGDLKIFKTVDLDTLRNATSPDEYGQSVFREAVRFGHLECCEEILKRCPQLLYHRHNYGSTALHQAAEAGNDFFDRFAKLLINAFMAKDEHRDGQSREDDCLLTAASKGKRETPLHLAVQTCCFEAAKLLIEADTQNKLLRSVNREDESAMLMAVKKQHLGLVKLLIEADLMSNIRQTTLATPHF